MECRDAQKFIMPFIRNDIEIEDEENFINHVSECKECRDELEIYAILEYGLSDEYDNEIQSFDFKQVIQDKIDRQKKQIENYNILKSFGGFAYIAINVIVLIMLGYFIFILI